MALQLVLVRHGESEGNRDGAFAGHSASPLTARGRAQAERVAEVLATPPPDVIYASDLRRAVDTAAPLAARLNLPVITREALRERDMGAWVGRTFKDIEAQHPDDWRRLVDRDPDHRPPGGESHRACGARVGAALDEILAAHPTGRVVVFSHGVAMHHMLRHLLRIDDPRTLFHVDNCAVQRLTVSAGGVVRIQALNDARHLVTLEV
ncbi:MAG: histidine phosphatase family protein [Polyangiales bacterium]